GSVWRGREAAPYRAHGRTPGGLARLTAGENRQRRGKAVSGRHVRPGGRAGMAMERARPSAKRCLLEVSTPDCGGRPGEMAAPGPGYLGGALASAALRSFEGDVLGRRQPRNRAGGEVWLQCTARALAGRA